MTTIGTAARSGVLLGDQGSSSIENSGKVFLLVDTNGDGDAADAGERIVFFDSTNESGLESPSENVFNLTQASDGSVYIGDGDTDSVYRLLDQNGDGDANDAGEATAWLTPENAAGVSTVTPNGVAEGPDGAVYVVNAGVSSAPQDAIYRTEDLNGDGDANDAGETTVWLDLQTIVDTSSPYDLTFVGDTAYLIDPSGSAEDTVFAIRDANGDNTITPDEVTSFATKTETGAPIDFTQAATENGVYVWEWLDPERDGTNRLVFLKDLDGSGAIDAPEETVDVWNASYLPEGFSAYAGFSVAAEGNQVVLTSNGSEPGEKSVYLLTDTNGDGDFFDEGETAVLASNALDETTLNRPRAVAFYEGSEETLATGLSIEGTDEDDALRGTNGPDEIFGRQGDDVVDGNSGDDLIVGNLGNDTLRGDAGEDQLFGSLGRDSLEGGADNDALFGGAGADTLDGGDGFDQLTGNSGNDLIFGGLGDDALFGNRGDDTLDGGDGFDVLRGAQGNDSLLGGADEDVLDGGIGNDILEGGADDDVLSGGRGSDTFIYSSGDGRDIITDFSAGDVLALDVDGIETFDDVLAAATTAGGSIVLSFGGGDEIVLAGVGLSDLSADDFSLVA